MKRDGTVASGRSVLGDGLSAVALMMYLVTASLSFAALIFTGPAADGLPRGTSTFLLASGIVMVLIGWRSQFPIGFGFVQDTAAIVLVPAIAVVVASGSDSPVRDTFVLLSSSSLITGVVMWTIGRAGLAGAARFMPTTVVAGFLAGTGWLLTKGGAEVMVNQSLGLGDLGDLVGFDLAKLWLPGVALGILIAVFPLIDRVSPLVPSLATIGSTAAFFAIVATMSSFSVVEDAGWLVGPFPDGGQARPIWTDLIGADWSAVTSATGQIGVVVLLSLLGVLLNISGIQVVLHRRVDVDGELRLVGITNVINATFGGLVAYHGLGGSALAQRLGVRSRWVAVIVGVVTMIFAFVGIGLLGYVPKFAAGGLLIGSGIGLLIQWVQQLRATSSGSDRAVSILILATICFVGILEGIVVGIVAACLFFVIRYSRIDAVRVTSSGHERRSVVERSPDDEARLREQADALAVYELQGSLFFGSVSGMATKIRERLAHTESPVEVVIVDFARVADIDSSAFAALAELTEDIEAVGATLVFSGLEAASVGVVERTIGTERLTIADNLDAALEHGEDHILALMDRPLSVDTPSDPFPDALLAEFETRSKSAGEVIMTEGEESGELIVVTSGSVHISQAGRDGTNIRLRTLRSGAILGEIGFLTGELRSATISAETDVELRVLTTTAHRKLRREQPELAIQLYERVLIGVADRAAAINESFKQALR